MMKTNEEIEQIAQGVLAKYVKRGGGYKAFPEIMTGEGIKFKEVGAGTKEFMGALTKGNNSQVYIMVNSSIDHIGRKNFTIAHELGHYFLSHQLKQNAFYCSNKEIVEEGTWKEPIEQEANYFASCFLILMEKPHMRKIYEAYNKKPFTILDVSLTDQTGHNYGDRDKWLKMLRNMKLPWVNVYGDEARELYGVDATPANYLISPEGKVIAKNIHDQELDQLLAKLMP